jgi:hypothetical protein
MEIQLRALCEHPQSSIFFFLFGDELLWLVHHKKCDQALGSVVLLRTCWELIGNITNDHWDLDGNMIEPLRTESS